MEKKALKMGMSSEEWEDSILPSNWKYLRIWTTFFALIFVIILLGIEFGLVKAFLIYIFGVLLVNVDRNERYLEAIKNYPIRGYAQRDKIIWK